ncbi:acyloxyacyl hydrolase-like [Elysia marginata]|uniref:Acyloxyacyl hydrolase-like n=1 Tax=Elysia marginata TaxID=1093978 RepID=A0AAV4FCG8_9GAST|nr:acyloxyacyl hydrolase-like [Elysia marginata]
MKAYKLTDVDVHNVNVEDYLTFNEDTRTRVCTAAIALSEQYAEINNQTLIHTLDKFCGFLPNNLRPACVQAVDFLGPLVIQLAKEQLGPDLTCHALKFCYTQTGTDTCRSFTPPSQVSCVVVVVVVVVIVAISVDDGCDDVCDGGGSGGGVDGVCLLVLNQYPAEQKKQDGVFRSIRSTKSLWPFQGDRQYDSNCNGIFGVNEGTGRAYEDELCEHSQPRGVALLGDSIGAHFHLPPEWIDPQKISAVNLLQYENSSTDGFKPVSHDALSSTEDFGSACDRRL